MSIVEELLLDIPDEDTLQLCGEPYIGKLIKAINNAIVSLKLDSECLSLDSTGKQLKEAVHSLPAALQVTILNDNVISYGKLARRTTDMKDYENHEQSIRERQLKHELIKYAAYVFMFLIAAFVIATIAISWKQEVAPDGSLGTGLFSTLLEIFKLIFAQS